MMIFFVCITSKYLSTALATSTPGEQPANLARFTRKQRQNRSKLGRRSPLLSLPFVRCLQVLAMQDGSAVLLILALGDPHVLERRERGQDGATDPRGVNARGRCRDTNFNILGRFLAHLGQQTVAKAREERRAAGQDNLREKRLAEVHVRLHNGLHQALVHTARLRADDLRAEQHLRRTELLRADLLKNNQKQRNVRTPTT
ncbi:hypothetical protein ON010_g17821 [Phytophthora cinnamomi]|nr:hypothetical protein ON010_g17821 [Phytophthora cinnamomi]